MYSWHLYRKDDPSTWPEIDCPMLVCIELENGDAQLDVYAWDNNKNQFFENLDPMEMRNKYFNYNECYYKYIGYLPSGYKAIKTKKCTLRRGTCEYEDDGYCFDAPKGTDCMFCEEVIEYHLGDSKRIWKEFEQ